MIIKLIFYFSTFIIIWAMLGYPLSLKVISKLYNKRKLDKNYDLKPTVTVLIVVHNEEKTILRKLQEIIKVDYPKNKIEYLISSDNSTDSTNKIVRDFIKSNLEYNIRLYEVKMRKGKTNAQNEAQKTIKTEFLVMTDANSILEKHAIKELMATFTSDEIAYVTGKVLYTNNLSSLVSEVEFNYWDKDLKIREIESRIQTITAGNGGLYACRNRDYKDFSPIQSHDTAMPLNFALMQKRAIANHDAIAYEKAGEVIRDEFKRKIRMNRLILRQILPNIKILNIFKYRWFTYFYLGHRTCRYLLWITHLMLFLTNIFLIYEEWFYLAVLIGQTSFYLLSLIKLITNSNNRILTLIFYYTITITAQWIGVYNILTGKSKPFWEKAESTR